MEHYISRLQNAASPQVVWDILKDMSDQYGLLCLCYHQVDFYSKGQSFKKIVFDDLQGCKDHARLAKEKHVTDPINQAAVSAAEPFTWDQIQDLIDLNERQRMFMRKAFQDLDKTVTVPVFGPAGRNGYFCFQAKGLQGFQPDFAKIQILLQFSHRRICAVTPFKAERKIPLTPRERDVLELVSLGKSNTIIAQILELSPHTVDTYMRRIYQKLGVSDRVSAAIKAHGSGMVSPSSSMVM